MTAVIVPRGVARIRWRFEPICWADRALLDSLFDSCSPETIQHRFFGLVRRLPPRYVDEVLGGRPEVHDAVVARHPNRRELAGLASLSATSVLGPGIAELAALVTDEHQGEGLGGAMIELLLDRARARGVRLVAASVLPGRAGLLGPLDRRLPVRSAHVTADYAAKVYDLI
jgi:GNAT superfamily N-acetyltransferase